MDTGRLPPHLRPALNALAGTLRNREPAIRERVGHLRAAHPELPPEALGRLLIRETRRRLATTGALSGAAAIVPGLGTALAVGAVAGQSLYALEQETELVLGLAMLHGHELEGSDERLLEALVVIGLAGGGVKLRDGVLVAGGQQVTVAAFRRFPARFAAGTGGHLVTRVLTRVGAGRAAASVARVAPLAVGMAAGAGFDWVAATALGRAAQRYYGPKGPVARSRLQARPRLAEPGQDLADVEVER